MKKEELINEEFLKQFKTGEELSSFLAQLQKRGIEAILEGEMEAYLGCEKPQKRKEENTRNGYSKKKIKTSLGESNISVPRDRESSYNPMLVPKRKNLGSVQFSVSVNLHDNWMSAKVLTFVYS